MIDSVRAGFAALRATLATAGVDLRVLKLAGEDGVLLAVDGEERPHVLLDGPPDGPVLESVSAISCRWRMLTTDGTSRNLLDITCNYPVLADVFDQFIVAIVDHASQSGASPAESAGVIIGRWRDFLVAPSAPLSAATAAAVIAELLVAHDIGRLSPRGVIGAWVGGDRSRHDFRRDRTALEVKMTTAHTSRVVTVHGEDQLEPPEHGELFLHLVRLEHVTDGAISIGDLVDRLLGDGLPAEALYRSVIGHGVPASELRNTTHRFEIRERVTFPIDGRAPRIIPSSFADGALPTGIVDISYRVDLDHVLELALDVTAFGLVLARLAGVDAG